MKKNLWDKRKAGVLMGVLVVVMAFGMPGVTKVSAKTQTPQEAAKKVEQTWQMAGSKKTTKTVRVTMAASRKKLWKTTSEFTTALNEAIYDNAYLSAQWEGMATEWMDLRVRRMKKSAKSYTDEVTGVRVKWTYRGGKLTYRFTINGRNKDTKEAYQDIEANKYCAAQIQTATKDMDQYDRAWYVNEWVQAHAHFEDGYTPGWAALKNRKAHGVCYDLAYFYELAACYAGVEHFGRVSNSGHTWNVVKIDGTAYYIDVAVSVATVEIYYELMAGLVDFLNNDTAMREKAAAYQNVKYGKLHGPIVRVREGYAKELWNKVQAAKASMTQAEWDEKINAYYTSDYCVFKAYGLTKAQLFSEPWEAGIARFDLQTLEQATDIKMPYSYGEYEKPKTWLYAWIRK